MLFLKKLFCEDCFKKNQELINKNKELESYISSLKENATYYLSGLALSFVALFAFIIHYA